MFYAATPYGYSNAVNRNTWQWDMTSCTPNDILGGLNDISIFQNGAQVAGLVNSAAAMEMNLLPMVQNFQAQMAQMWQMMMTNMQSGNFNIDWSKIIDPSKATTPAAPTTPTSKTGDAEKIAESKIISTLEKMGSGKAVSERMNQEIIVKDKDGNEVKTTVLKRLLELCNEYRKDPENAQLSKENYEKIWQIVSNYDKNGDISTDEFKELLKIAKNPSDEQPEEKKVETPLTDNTDSKKADVQYQKEVKDAAEYFKKALYGWGTDYEQLGAALNALNSENIVEVFDKFYSDHGINEGETLVDAIYNDFDDWTNTWYGVTGSANTFKSISEKLVERAENHIEAYGDTNDNALRKAIDNFNSAFASINDDNYDSKKAEINKMFKDMVDAIKTAESNKLAEEKKAKEEEKSEN